MSRADIPTSGPEGAPLRSRSLRSAQERAGKESWKSQENQSLIIAGRPCVITAFGLWSTFADIISFDSHRKWEVGRRRETGQLALAPPFQI